MVSCARCHKLLKNPLSIAIGMGPICRAKVKAQLGQFVQQQLDHKDQRACPKCGGPASRDAAIQWGDNYGGGYMYRCSTCHELFNGPRTYLIDEDTGENTPVESTPQYQGSVLQQCDLLSFASVCKHAHKV